MILLKKEWSYTLEKIAESYILSVVCGSVGIYEIKIRLNAKELEQFKSAGTDFIEQLANQIRFSPSSFQDRHLH